MNALHIVNGEIAETKDANIYMLWGLHFSTFTVGESEDVSINLIGSRLAKEIKMYLRYLGGR